MSDPLLVSLKEEREFVLLPRIQRMKEALEQIYALAEDAVSPAKLANLVRIRDLARGALEL